jgi:hypothetical protein
MSKKAPKGKRTFAADLKRIREHLSGIEWLFATILYAVWPLFISFWLYRFFDKRRSLAVECYVVASMILTIVNWLAPNIIITCICSYFSVSTVLTLLQVVFVNKILGEMESPERSLILFVCNVAQIVFVFAAWYQLEVHLSRSDALLQSLLVLATAGYPKNAPLLVELQISTDFVLLAVFLSHLVGKVAARMNVRSSD